MDTNPARYDSELPKQIMLVLSGQQIANPNGTAVDLLGILRSRWWLILLVTALFAFAALTYCLITPTWYRAQAILEPLQPDSGMPLPNSLGGLGSLTALAGIDLTQNETYKNEYLARFTSREFTYRFLTDEGLLPILFARDWDREHDRWKTPLSTHQPTLERAYKYFNDKVRTVSEDRQTGLIKLTIDWKDPVLATNWANQLVTRFNDDSRQTARSEAQQSLQFLNRELTRTDLVELRQTIGGLIETQIRKSMLANVREQYAFKIIDPAYLPGKQGRVWPRPALLISIAALFGLLITVLYIAGFSKKADTDTV